MLGLGLGLGLGPGDALAVPFFPSFISVVNTSVFIGSVYCLVSARYELLMDIQ